MTILILQPGLNKITQKFLDNPAFRLYIVGVVQNISRVPHPLEKRWRTLLLLEGGLPKPSLFTDTTCLEPPGMFARTAHHNLLPARQGNLSPWQEHL